MQEYLIDQGTNFGMWDDPVSHLMYFGVMPTILRNVDTDGRVADYGGANGIMKKFIPHAVSIDIDESKQPDIVDDVRTHVGEYDLIIIRYVLHYLTPLEQSKLFRHIASFHKGEILVIQFTNDGTDYDRKVRNSLNETKYFLREKELLSLVERFRIIEHNRFPYIVTKEFYANRLKNPNAIPHGEFCDALLLRSK